MRVAVIGAGPVGAAAARNLARAGHDVLVVGTAEPADRRSHDGPFASHWDAGRITRALDPDPFWSRVSRASIARYADIASEGGEAFFADCGTVIAGAPGGAMMRGVARVAAAEGIAARALGPVERAAALPMLAFAPGHEVWHEPVGAGWIDPRAMVRAQLRAAERHGAHVLRATATALREGPGGVVVETADAAHRADRVLVCAGGFSDALLPRPQGFAVYARTVALFELDGDEAERLAAMPSVVWERADGRDAYALPPIRYPDGRVRIKIGGDPDDRRLTDAAATGAWFRGSGSAEVGALLTQMLCDLVPGLRWVAMHTEPCVTVFTARDRPAIGPVSARIAVAAAGCGRGAKCADELGRIGALAVLGESVPAELAPL